MANTINVPRAHLILGLCLPLAVLLGYFLAQPLDSTSVAVVVLVLSMLCVPLFMKWHHPLLVVSWNACANPLFLPGRPALWMLMAMISLFFAILARSVDSRRRFIQVPSITKPLLFFAAVVLLTAQLTGGIGIRSLGSERYGGRGYYFIFTAIAGYFALTSQRIPTHRAGLYVGLFLLSGLTALIGDLAYMGGRPFYFLTAVFVPDSGLELLDNSLATGGAMVRLGALPIAGAAIYGWLLARTGVSGILDLGRPWRLLLVVFSVIACLASGYRSTLVLFALTFVGTFWLEGLHRTRLLPILAGIILLACTLVLPQTQKLPFLIQRTMSFLPVPVDPMAKESAKISTEWRVEMWKQVLPQVPKYLIKGKGYALDPNDLYMAQQSASRGFGIQAASALVAGDYHNGPLSVLIPFGILGFLGFGWIVVASIRLLYYFHRFGNPALQRINTFLLASFLAKIALFVFVFGALSNDLFSFIGLVGVAVSLNGTPQASLEPEISNESLNIMPERVY